MKNETAVFRDHTDGENAVCVIVLLTNHEGVCTKVKLLKGQLFFY